MMFVRYGYGTVIAEYFVRYDYGSYLFNPGYF